MTKSKMSPGHAVISEGQKASSTKSAENGQPTACDCSERSGAKACASVRCPSTTHYRARFEPTEGYTVNVDRLLEILRTL